MRTQDKCKFFSKLGIFRSAFYCWKRLLDSSKIIIVTAASKAEWECVCPLGEFCKVSCGGFSGTCPPLADHPGSPLLQGSPASRPKTSISHQIISDIRLEIKCTINVMHLNHPKTTPPTKSMEKLPSGKNQSLVLRRLGTMVLKDMPSPTTHHP